MNRKTKHFFIIGLLFMMMWTMTLTASAATVTPGKVTLKSAKSIAYNKNQITWKKVNNATHYDVYIKVSGKWKKLARVGGSVCKYTHTSSKNFPIKTGNTYVYTVRAYNSSSKKQGIKNTTGISVKALPGKASITKIKATSGQNKITWKQAQGATHYVIYYKTDSTSWKKIAVVNNSVTSYTHKRSTKYPIQANSKYYYTVRSYCKNGKAYGSYTNNIKKVITPPDKVEIIGMEEIPDTGYAKLSWKAIEDTTLYQILYKQKNDTKWKTVFHIIGSQTYAYVPTLKFYESEVTFTVCAYNGDTDLYGSYDSKGIHINYASYPKTQYSYEVKFFNQPYASTEFTYYNYDVTPIYIKTDNPNGLSIELHFKDSSGNEIGMTYTSSGDYHNVEYLEEYNGDVMRKVPGGYLVSVSSQYSGLVYIEIWEYQKPYDSYNYFVPNKYLVKIPCGNITFKDYKMEKKKWMQSIINKVTTPSMSKPEKMTAISKYLLQNSSYQKFILDHNLVYLVEDAGIPPFISYRWDSFVSPTYLTEFGEMINYPVENLYYRYPVGSDGWKYNHFLVESKADKSTYECCPFSNSGYLPYNSFGEIPKINLLTYNKFFK